MELRSLTDSDFDTILETFNEAFSDYVIKLTLTADQLREMLTRRGYMPEVSVGVFDEGRMVAFTLNGFDGGRAYDTGTGVIPTYRRRGLATQMIEFVRPRLRERGAAHYVLEVIESNRAAVELYLGLGFEKNRRLQCWSYEPERMPEMAFGEAAIRTDWHDVEPSWQNSTNSLNRSRDRYVVLGFESGYATVYPATGDMPQLAVAREQRRRGLGRALLDAAATVAKKPLRIINVDERDAGISAFLEHCGAKRTVRQIEMTLLV